MTKTTTTLVVPKFVADGTVGIRKLFEDGEYYNGTIESFDEENGWYFVQYEDGDVEDITETECAALVNDYNNYKNDIVVKDNSITLFYILRDNPALCDGAGE
ncbi:hypothetical protein FRACYDRAFT_247097 [Fragilariopsis cylindrus CCMP1102]|uniref:PTM/DIR17-like Tudor domain-containing protein n=1 Tax=Fragilariopsis cylindrus CCMP1102 TaxID=635003 RepID=A0A1E7EXL3_9STRA|nr:hypothetical protein FRACYDRAFT_247097 [Fragilariopsis cylindrus CCMP1102]|eukprot:OEU10555.1 hypothetical protein FRACYDRAFT_247097 [Fragilariopsis cylindrus CCMP1102]